MVHGTGVAIALATGHAVPPVSPMRALGVVQLHPYAPGINPVAHLAAIVLVLIAALELLRRGLRWRANRAASTTARATEFAARAGPHRRPCARPRRPTR